MRKCKVCGERYTPTRQMQVTCDRFECKVAYAEKAAAKSKASRDKADRKETRERKEKAKRPKDHRAEAQAVWNRARRLELLAKGYGCMSCGKTQSQVQAEQGWKLGGAWDAGHFLGRGARPNLAFEPDNVWLQCKSCNAGSGKYERKKETVSQAYEVNLRAEIGDARVDALKADHEPRHLKVEDYQRIKAEAREKLRQIKKTSQ